MSLVFGDTLTIENILKRVSPYQIFKYYYPQLDIGRVTNSPFRTDKKPSFGLFVSKENGEVLYNDLKGGDSGNWVSFLIKLYGIQFYDVLRMVNRDFNLDLMDFKDTPLKIGPVKSKIVEDVKPEVLNQDLKLNVIRRKWQQHDADYWKGRYGITSDILGKETYPISCYWFNDWTTIIAEKHSYAYDFYFDGKIFRRKIYQPFSEKDKWKTNLNNLVIDGIKDIPKEGDLLIITKSRKDRLVLKALGYHSIATNNESSWIPDVNFYKLNDRWDKIMILFDNDEAGDKNSIKFAEKYSIERATIPIVNSNVKDIADYRYYFKEEQTRKLLKDLF